MDLMVIGKTSIVATNLIYEFVKKLNFEDYLTDAEKKFINLEYGVAQLSLTNSQSIKHQLRFYDSFFGYSQVNNIAYKCVQQLSALNIKVQFNVFKCSEIENLFLSLVSKYMIDSNKICGTLYKETSLHTPDINITSVRHYLNIGDSWTAIWIGEKLLQINDKQSSFELMHILALAYNSVSNTLAGENLLMKLIQLDLADNPEYNKSKVSAYYILAMIYMRHHPKSLKNTDQAHKYLDTAYQLLDQKDFVHDDKEFTKIFNRNGYALILFASGNVDMAVELLNKKISQLEKEIIPIKGEYALLHKTVLMYNLYQCYLQQGLSDKAEEILLEINKIDFYDTDYRYDLVKLYFDNGELEKGKKELEIIGDLKAIDYPTHFSYLGYYYLEKNQLDQAKEYYFNAFLTLISPYRYNEYLYNYLYVLYMLEEQETIIQLKNSINLEGNYMSENIRAIFEATGSSVV
ncbi:hypothetical protein HCA00_14375 [Listeria booriae]|uniref:tetratricopeptide repeat protein n=1 Tax=Listeria booriae TaxID=1552123 RepID=UPI00162452BE|nr:hypothetical protein [Listeria booriae]MBC1334730.1 hypothetical protein [Listeria booriae]MBC1943603.1 hypothetical protein [Listeria booriae]MBC6129997.1 hypothetical protein [Listeria booriae]MBC6166955.1 hypothetical protein [Listeria booriae]